MQNADGRVDTIDAANDLCMRCRRRLADRGYRLPTPAGVLAPPNSSVRDVPLQR
jgi:hypothetical protein